MDITIEKSIIIEKHTVKGVQKVNTIKDISISDRLFYELGYYVGPKFGEDPEWEKDFVPENWRRTGKFEEIKDVKSFLEREESRLSMKIFLDHHNFVVLKS